MIQKTSLLSLTAFCVNMDLLAAVLETDFKSGCADEDCLVAPASASSLLTTNTLAKQHDTKRFEDLHEHLRELKLHPEISTLLEHSSALLGGAGSDITPGVIEILKTLMVKIDDEIFPRIKSHHANTQQKIRSSVSQLRQHTNAAVGGHQAVMEAIAEVEACKRRGRSCQMSWNEMTYSRKEIPMCHFGDRLQEKCAAKKAYDDLISDIEGSGSVNSDSDRRQEWKGASMIRCMLEEHTNGADFDKATLAKCKPLSDYSRDVGELDLQTNTAKDLNSGNNFNCVDTTFQFGAAGQQTVRYELGENPFEFCHYYEQWTTTTTTI
jgi:hypothetical protein